jgi:FkbM family methyltransferase
VLRGYGYAICQDALRNMKPAIATRTPRTVRRVPLLVETALTLVRWRVRGSQRLLNLFKKLGLANVIVEYEFGRGIRFDLPMFRHCWSEEYVNNYESKLIDVFCKRLDPLTDVVLLDCGADIGIFSALTCAKSAGVTRVVAFEPNTEAFDFLQHNLDKLPVKHKIVTKAVSSFNGRGKLEVPSYPGYRATDPCGRFLVPGDGPVEVTTIDSLDLRGGDIAMKIDVEGGELEVLKGAANTIRSARNCVVAWEAHPQVAARTNVDPIECLRFLRSVRPFSFQIAETGETPSEAEPLVRQGQTSVLNVIGWTHHT